MIDNVNNLIIILTIVLGAMFMLLLVLGLIYLSNRMKKSAEKETTITDKNGKTKTVKGKLTLREYSKDSIFNFMEFDKIEDNMIVQKNGDRFLMAVECQGINYDLMSQAEKIAVEEGFIQFLNTLTHPIQIYTQTRTINLESSIQTYREKVKQIEANYEKEKLSYQRMQESGRYSKEQLQRAYYELTKDSNLCEYGKDIIYNTERMSLNKNVLNKKYYIIIPYYPSDLGQNNFDKEEIKNLAFSELYTKAQSIIRTLGACEVNGRVLDSLELVDLLYVAYNRDDAEIYGVDKAIASGFDELYSTAPDVLNKKMRMINDKIDQEAINLANSKIAEAKSDKQKEIEEKEENMDDLISELAKIILTDNSELVGEEIADRAVEKIDNEQKARKQTKQKGGTKDVGEEKKPRRRTTRTA